MTLAEALRDLPDEAMVPVGWIRELMDPEETPAVDEDPWAADFRKLREIATRNLCRQPWDGDGA